jgi:hypothetical protein
MAVQGLAAAAGALDTLFNVGGHLGLTLALARELHHPLHKAVAILALQAQQCIRRRLNRGALQRFGMGAGAGAIAQPARELRCSITLERWRRLGIQFFLMIPGWLAQQIGAALVH